MDNRDIIERTALELIKLYRQLGSSMYSVDRHCGECNHSARTAAEMNEIKAMFGQQPRRTQCNIAFNQRDNR
jgi:hypothetical protein